MYPRPADNINITPNMVANEVAKPTTFRTSRREPMDSTV